MAMKVILLAFAFMLVVATEVSSACPSKRLPPPEPTPLPLAPMYPPNMAAPLPTPLPVTPMYPPKMPPSPLPMPRPHIPKKCAMGCVEYCRVKPNVKSKRSCQKICSLCCQKCNVCIPTAEENKCTSWDNIMFRGVQVMCP